MHLVVIGWLYVALMMAVAEATNSTGTVLGAVITFLLYGLLPVSLVVYLMTAPARRRAIKAREEEARQAAIRAAAVTGEPAAAEVTRVTAAAGAEAATAAQDGPAAVADAPPSAAPDAGGEASADPVAPVREKA